MNTTALVAAGSLIAILFLAWLAHWLGLGDEETIRDPEHARSLANEAQSGFQPVETAIDRSGAAALLRDPDGRVILIRRHGAHFVSRVLDHQSAIARDGDHLLIQPSHRRFGSVKLDLGDAAGLWIERLRA